VIRKSRLFVALGLVLALGITGVALADGADDNTSRVAGKVQPKKVPKKKLVPVNLFTQVSTEWDVPIGTQQNPEEVYIDFGRNIKFAPRAAPVCNQNIEVMSTQQARQACPNKSNLGVGRAHARIPGFPSPENRVEDFVVTAFNGSNLPGRNRLRLHAYSAALGAAPGNPSVVEGRIVKSPLGKRYGQRLSVPDAPDVAGDLGGLVLFNATIKRASKVVKARCGNPKKFFWRAQWVYDDASSETHQISKPCVRR